MLENLSEMQCQGNVYKWNFKLKFRAGILNSEKSADFYVILGPDKEFRGPGLLETSSH